MSAPLEILVLFYSHHGSVEKLARKLAQGIDSVSGVSARLRTVPKLATVIDAPQAAIPATGPPYVELSDLEQCSGLALGSPVRFGNMAAPLKYFIDSTAAQWLSGALCGKPAAVFTSSASMHGGQESTLLSMMLPLLHHGMLIVGLPYTEPGLNETTGGGTPSGASHVTGQESQIDATVLEARLAFALGARLANTALKLATP